MPADQSPRVEVRLVRAHGLAALVTLGISLLFGLLAAVQLLEPNLTANTPWLTWGRVRYDHTQGILFGWLGNAFFAFLYHAVPMLTGRPVTSARLGQWLFGLWNFAVVLPGWMLVLAGFSQPLEWAEFPLVIDAFVMLALVLATIQFLPPFFRAASKTSTSPAGTSSAGWSSRCSPTRWATSSPSSCRARAARPSAGCGFTTPSASSSRRWRWPSSTSSSPPPRGRPIFSHFLSMLGFWLLFFLYPLNGTHHYIFSVIPMTAQTGAIAASALLGVDVHHRGRQSAAVAARLRLVSRATPRCASSPWHRLLPGRQLAGLAAGADGASTRRCISPTG